MSAFAEFSHSPRLKKSSLPSRLHFPHNSGIELISWIYRHSLCLSSSDYLHCRAVQQNLRRWMLRFLCVKSSIRSSKLLPKWLGLRRAQQMRNHGYENCLRISKWNGEENWCGRYHKCGVHPSMPKGQWQYCLRRPTGLLIANHLPTQTPVFRGVSPN